uniref:Large ribosomal subunit protein P2 n=1 Tax=Panthera leo TaxID=9689 RepID=A0A8C8Y3Q6_PANLE
MRYVASYLLAALGGNASPSAKDIKKILDSVGIEADDDRLNKVISELNGKNIEDVIAQGIGKLASVPAGGAVAVSAAPGSAAPAAGSTPAAGKWRLGQGLCWESGMHCGPCSLCPSSPQQRRRKTKRRKNQRSRMMTWDLACLIRVLLSCK